MATLTYRITEKLLKNKIFLNKSKYLIGNLFIVFSLINDIEKFIQRKNALFLLESAKTCAMKTDIGLLEKLLLPKCLRVQILI